MIDSLIVGPYRTIEIDNGVRAPFYIIPFDEQGRYQAPLMLDQLLTTLSDGTHTDVFLFSHGWNADWNIADSTFNSFLQGYVQMQSRHGLSYAGPFRPILVGIFWHAVVLVMPWEGAPAIAGYPKIRDLQVAQERQDVESIAAALAGNDVEQFYALAQNAQGLNRDEALELARIPAPFTKGELRQQSSTEEAPIFFSRSMRALLWRSWPQALVAQSVTGSGSVTAESLTAAQNVIATLTDPAFLLASEHTDRRYDEFGGMNTYLMPPRSGRKLSPC